VQNQPIQPKKKESPAAGEELTMDERVERLELALRRGRYVVFGLVGTVVLIGTLFAWREFGTRGTVKARTIQIVGAGGARVIELTSNNIGGVIRTSNLDGNSLFLTAADPEGRGTIATFNGKGNEIVYIAATSTGGAVAVMNNIGKDVVNLQSSKTNCGLMIAKDYDGNSRESLSGSRPEGTLNQAGQYPQYR
jgi:hypothetical protein